MALAAPGVIDCHQYNCQRSRAILADSADLTDVERLYYLKTSLRDDAAKTIKNIPVTEENYQRAWDRLVSHFDNKRSLVNAALGDLFNIPSLSKESAEGIRRLRESTNEATETLQALGRPVDKWDDILVYLTLQRLDSCTCRDWQTTRGDSMEPPTYADLDAFLKTRIEALKFVEHPKGASTSEGTTKRKNAGISAHTASPPAKSPQCSHCSGPHFIAACDAFRSLASDKRESLIYDAKLCFNCLGHHFLRNCRSPKTCRHCRGRHHTLLHNSKGTSPTQPPNHQREATSTSPQPSQAEEPKASVNSLNIKTSPHHSILLATARVIVASELQRKLEVRALVDPCSEATFISESIAQQLRLRRQASFIPVSGVGGARCQSVKAFASILISPHFDNSKDWKLKALILPHLSDYVPPRHAAPHHWAFAVGLQMADPHIGSADSVGLIIGADLYPKLIQEGIKKCPSESIIAQATELGWILTGAAPSSSTRTRDLDGVTSHQIRIDVDLHDTIERFWLQEETLPQPLVLTREEVECEAHFASTHRRDSQGRYILRLPFKKNATELGDSSGVARLMLQRMQKRFSQQPQLHELYDQFMQDYLSLGHMSPVLVSNPSGTENKFFLPHHGVLKAAGDKRKLRVVFNGSVKLDDGLNLNDCLHTGPKLQSEIFDVLLRWRTHRYVFSSDIEKMFRQILIDPTDRRYQQVYWYSSAAPEVHAYMLNTVTYGLASSPFQAIRTLRQLAQDEATRFPAASQVLVRDSYVDDILSGADSLPEAQRLQHELIELLMAGGFPLGKWTANHDALLASLAPEQIAPSQSRTWPTEEAVQMLGISWQPNEDCFRFFLQDSPPACLTKRKVLSFIGRLYDPLGWISPIIVGFKIFMQKLWYLGLHWDDPLPSETRDRWQALIQGLSDLAHLRVPRWVGTSISASSSIELHGFADASQDAYGAVVYLRSIGSSSTKCVILASKTKVAPLKQVSLPRLELCAAHMLTLLTKRIRSLLSLPEVPVHLWSDSTITLSWIQGHPTQWKTYVANRVSEVQSSLPGACWHHVAGTDNPADLASRGTSADVLNSTPLWLSGPSFLVESKLTWPSGGADELTTELDRRPVASHATSRTPQECDLLRRYSTLIKLLRVTARCLAFIQRLRMAVTAKKSYNSSPVTGVQEPSELTPLQIDSALKIWITQVQGLFFEFEVKSLSQDLPLSKRSPLFRLNPFIDSEGLLRVGGRLRHSLLHPDEKHPYILPSTSFLSLLLVRDAHQRTIHGGTQLTLSHLRRRYWILRGRQLCKQTIFRCIKCWRHKSTPTSQLMSDLPDLRVQQCRPFLHSGVDYAGPISLKYSKGRGTRSFKGYIAVFICLATRAVHLEAASGYSTADFLQVYRRFVARRGICATLSSDCGTNFIGADKELRELFAQAKTQNSEITHLLATEGTEWRFNPPSAPHFGGIWEAAVKSTKHHLRRVLGETLLTFEEMSTLLACIEACLNSRPLQPLRDDPTDLAVLTPAHFLIGAPLCTIPEPSTLEIQRSRLSRAQLLRNMYEHFWSRWSAEYLHELQQRPKWQAKNASIRVGQMCLLRSDLTPPCKWHVARIIDVSPGSDGLIRVVKIKTATSTLVRPVAKISILPFQEDDSSPGAGEGGRNVAY